MPTFHVGQQVVLTEDHPVLGLRAGDTGVVWVIYDVEPTAYEVTFRDQDGMKFDVTLHEEELADSFARYGHGGSEAGAVRAEEV